MKTKHLNYKIEIETLSPVHIGNGEKLSSVGDFYQTGSRIFLLDNDKLFKKLKERNLINNFIEKVLEEKINLDFYDTLIEWGINPEDFVSREMPLHQKDMKSTFNDELHLHIKLKDKAYLPGSTLKGMIRTALIYDFYNKFPQYLKNLEDLIDKEIDDINNIDDDKLSKIKKNKRKQLNKLWNKINKQFFPDFVFHVLRISDSKLFGEGSLSVEQIRRVVFFDSETEGVDWLEECIDTGNKSSFEISFFPDIQDDTIDNYFESNKIDQNEFYISDWDFIENAEIETIFQKINNYTVIQIKSEMDMINNIVKDNVLKQKLLSDLDALEKEISGLDSGNAICRLGSGKTIYFHTLLPLFNNKIKEKLIFILKKEDTETLFPATRVLCVDENKMKGWIKLKTK